MNFEDRHRVGPFPSSFLKPVDRLFIVADTGMRECENIRVALSSAFGYYRFDDVEVGQTYLVDASSKRFEFVPRTITIHDELTEFDLVALP